MKKILIALPLVLIMLLTMVPVMAAFDKTVSTEITVVTNPITGDEDRPITKNIELKDQKVAENEKELKAFVKEEVQKLYPEKDYLVEVKSVVPYEEGAEKQETELVYTIEVAKANSYPQAFTETEDGAKAYLKSDADEDSFTDDGKLKADATTDDKEEAYVEKRTIPAVEEVQASAVVTVKAKCAPEETKKAEEKCPELCDEITVKVYDIFNGKYIDHAQMTYDVKKYDLPDRSGILKHYMDNYFPGNYQPLLNWNNVQVVEGMDDVEDCTLVIKVLPATAKIQIIHELYDCCITPDGDYSYNLAQTFIEDNEKFRGTGVPDGFMGIPFLEFHNDLMINQEKAAEYAKTRLEKVNALDYVFQSAKFYDGINLTTPYMTGVVTDFNGNKRTITNDVPTIVLKYYRGECVQEEETEEQVDDAKVVAGAQTTTPTAQQLPATGAKDVTAFFMSAVALLGLGIFFAKKH